MEEKYFVIVDMGYDGLAINTFSNEEEAIKDYKRVLIHVTYDADGHKDKDSYYEGAAIIKGVVLKQTFMEYHLEEKA